MLTEKQLMDIETENHNARSVIPNADDQLVLSGATVRKMDLTIYSLTQEIRRLQDVVRPVLKLAERASNEHDRLIGAEWVRDHLAEAFEDKPINV